MDFLSRVIMIILSFFSVFSFIFPSVNTPETEEPSSSIVEESTTEEETTEEETTAPASCKHIGGVATCTSKAVCIRCGEQYGDGGTHKYRESITPATCTAGGYTVFYCTVCEDTYIGAETEATGHNYQSRVIEPTCTETGRTVYVCRNCGDNYSENETPATGHAYEKTEVLPDCVHEGVYVYTCNKCGDEYSEPTSKPLGHNYIPTVIEPTCKAQGYTIHTCPGCKDSFTDNAVPPLGHKFTTYTSDNNANCHADGTETAYCDNGCGLFKTRIEEGSMLPHVDNNKDKYCDIGGEELHMEFTHLEYDSDAVKSLGALGISLNKYLSRADANDNIYIANQGFDEETEKDLYGIIISPYYTVKVDGVSVPVYGTITYSGTTSKGVLHSFSEIYVEKGEYATFEIEIASGDCNISNAIVLPESYGETVTVTNGTARAILSGFGAHTFMFNNENQSYVYTIFVREEIDEEAEINELRKNYTVHVVDTKNSDGVFVHTYTAFYGKTADTMNQVIYLKKGSYVSAKHVFDITSDYDNYENPEKHEYIADGTAASLYTGIGLTRMPFINVCSTENIKVLGYGALDLSKLDRGERRGLVFTYSNNIEVRGVKIINAPEWSFVTYNCDNVKIKDVDVFGYKLNSDAFAIANSTNVTVTGCFARSGDDLFGVKTLGGQPEDITENVFVENCYAWAGKARAFGVFGESNRNMTNVSFRNNYVLYHDATWDENRIPAIGIIIEVADPNNGAIQFNDITFENIEISRNKAAAANVLIYNQVNNFTLNNIVFKNISYQSNAVKNRIVTYSTTSAITNISFENNICGGTRITDSNKTSYFSEEATNYIIVK